MSAAKGGKLTTILKGGSIFSVGVFSSYLLQFIAGIIVVRLLSQSDYGNFNLAHMTISLVATMCLAGLPNTMARYARSARQDPALTAEYEAVLRTALTTIVLLSLTFTALLIWFAPAMGSLLGKSEFSPILRILALTVPLTCLMTFCSAYFRTRNNAKPKVLFEDILFNVVRVTVLGIAAILALQLTPILFLYVLSAVVAACLYFLYFLKTRTESQLITWRLGRLPSLLRLSLPVMGVSLIPNVSNWIVGAYTTYVHSPETLAIFAAPNRLTNLLSLPLVAIGYLYLPLASTLIRQQQQDQLSSLYHSSAKWGLLAAMPISVFIFGNAEFIVTTLFGPDYVHSADILRIICVGTTLSVLLGSNYLTLIALDDPGYLLRASLAALVTVCLLSFLLIPAFGYYGTALAATGGLVVSNLLMSYRLASAHGITPISGALIRANLFTLLVCGGWLALLNWLTPNDWFVAIGYFALAFLIAFLAPALTRALDAEDEALYSKLKGKLPAPLAARVQALINQNKQGSN